MTKNKKSSPADIQKILQSQEAQAQISALTIQKQAMQAYMGNQFSSPIKVEDTLEKEIELEVKEQEVKVSIVYFNFPVLVNFAPVDKVDEKSFKDILWKKDVVVFGKYVVPLSNVKSLEVK